MRIATWEAVRTIQVSTLPEPEPGPSDIVIDVSECGICGSDVHSYLEGAWIAPGVALGHEFSGTISRIGDEVADLGIGDRVTVNPGVSCSACDRCREGSGNLCQDMSGSSGGFADEVLVRHAVRDTNVFVLPDALSFEAAAFLEPMSVAMRAVRHLESKRGSLAAEPVLVTGLGTIGQCVVQILAARGLPAIVAADTSGIRRDAAAASGATEVIDPLAGDMVETLIERHGSTRSPYRPRSGAFGAAFECAGAPSVFDQLFQLVRAGGAISLVALTAAPVTLDPNVIVQKELAVTGSFAYTTADCRAAFQLIADGSVHPETLITQRYPLDRIGEAFEMQSRSTESVKVMIHP